MSEAAPRPSTLVIRGGYGGFVLLGWNAVLIPSLIRSVEHDMHQSDAAFGLFYFISSLFYATGAFSGGMLTERLGRRLVLPTAAVSLGLGLLGEALAPTWPVLLCAMVFVSWGAGVLDGGINGMFLDLFREARGGALNLLHLFFSIGALVSPFLVGLLVAAGVDWHLILAVTALFALPLVVTLRSRATPSGIHDRPTTTASGVELAPSERSLLPFIFLACSIGFYVASEIGTSNWLVKFLSNVPDSTATAVLSIFWGGVALGRLLSNRIAEHFDYTLYTAACSLLSALALTAAVLVPWVAVTAVLFGITGLFSGPVYPMIMSIGGNLYPHRLSALSGSLAGAAVVGTIVYPPLMGVMADHIGLRAGMLGAAALGVPTALAILLATSIARRAGTSASQPYASVSSSS